MSTYWVWGLGFRVKGLGFRVWGLGGFRGFEIGLYMQLASSK